VRGCGISTVRKQLCAGLFRWETSSKWTIRLTAYLFTAQRNDGACNARVRKRAPPECNAAWTAGSWKCRRVRRQPRFRLESPGRSASCVTSIVDGYAAWLRGRTYNTRVGESSDASDLCPAVCDERRTPLVGQGSRFSDRQFAGDTPGDRTACRSVSWRIPSLKRIHRRTWSAKVRRDRSGRPSRRFGNEVTRSARRAA